MDGPQHPERTESTVRATNVPDPFSNEQPREVASPQGDADGSAAKRQHDDDGDDPVTKRAHMDAEEPEELDLDALLAQLQQHTDSAKLDHGRDDSGNRSEDHNDDHRGDHSGDHAAVETGEQDRPETHGEQAGAEPQVADSELSIEQQLKGALSSLQDMDGDDEDDDDESTALAIDQLSSILKPSSGDRPTQADEHHAEVSQKEASSERGDLESTRRESSSFTDNARDETRLFSVGSGKEDRMGLVGQQQQDQAGTEDGSGGHSGTPDSEPSHNKRESLLAKMPPPPAQGSGPLPPMPPPPAAFTSPTAPLTALELSRSTHPGALATADSDNDSIDARLRHIHKPTFSEVPTHSKSYEAAIADQVDKSISGDGQDSVSGLLLNDSQSVLQARQKSILLLDALASQVLDFLSFSHYQETLATVMQPDSERGMAYRMLLDAFEDVKRMYLKWRTRSSSIKPEPKHDEVRPFLPYDLPGVEPTRENMTTIQRANMATFVAAIFGTVEIGFWELDKWFLKVFVPVNGRLFKQQATIYLDLKTQAYISAVEGTDDKEVHEEAIEHLFPKDLEATIQNILGERMSLAPSEQDFVEKCHRRKDNILAEDKGNLSTKYHWVPFLREICDYISRNHYTLLPRRKMDLSTSDHTTHAHYSTGPTTPRGYPSVRSGSVGSARLSGDNGGASARRRPSSNLAGAAVTATSNNDTADVQVSAVKHTDTPNPKLELDDKASSAEPSDGPSTKEGTPNDGQAGAPSERREPSDDSNRQPDIPAEGHPLFPPLPKQVLPPPSGFPPQSSSHKDPQHSGVERSRRPGPRAHSEAPVAANSPTDTLAVYEAAKASAEGTDAIRPKTSMFTTRRVWTKEEEEALLKGMDRVQGPYWAQILELYGPGGKISEVLKDRSQVQLKDKARNLKMFFVRLGLPIPAVFQYVTGDYETRRSSGKKIREKKQHAGPSGLSQEILRNDSPQRALDEQSATQPRSAIVPSAPHQTSSASRTDPNAGRSNEAESERAEDSSRARPAAEPSTARVPLNAPADRHRSSVASAGPKDTGGSPGQPQATEGSTENPRLDRPDQGHLISEGAMPVAPSAEATRSSSSELQKTQPHEPVNGDEREAAQAEFASTDDKDDDLSSLLNRVGEYVENH